MKVFAFKHPYLTGVLSFIVVVFGGSVLGMLAGIWILASDKSQPLGQGDPHDGAAMASGMIFSLSIMVSLVLGILAGLTTTHILRTKSLDD
jgi:hypothetical protein